MKNLVLGSLFLAAVVSLTDAAVPPTRTELVRETLHGVAIDDPYRWLEALESESEDVKTWTTSQNEYTRGVLDNLPGRKELENRLAQLLSIGRIDAPAMRGNLYFNLERKGSENQPVLYVREGHDGAKRVLLDPNTLDAKGLYSLDSFTPNSDGSLVALGLSYAGDEMTVIYVMETATGRWLSDEIPGKAYVAGWSPDSAGFLYGKLEDPKNAYSRVIKYHRLGTHHRQDPILVMQDKPTRIPGASMTEDGRWILVSRFEGWSKTDLYVVDAAEWRRTGTWRETPIAEGMNARFQSQFVLGNTLYMQTTLDAPNGMVYSIDLTNPSRESWKIIIPHRADAVLEGVSQARGVMVATYTIVATTRFERFALDGQALGEIELPGIGTAGMTTRWDRTEAFFSFASFNEPRGVYRLDLATGEKSLWARPEVPVDPSIIEVKQVHYPSKDGTSVPMFLVHKKGLTLNGANPTLLYGYGGFSSTMSPSFSPALFPWLENGGVYALANIRGGDEYGESWHEAGMLANKQNVFDDFIAAGEWLVEQKYTSPANLAVMGGSNGGLLIGAVVTQRPDLFAAGVSQVPLLDMLRYHQFLMAKFWVPEYGSAENAEQFGWLMAYSPYHKVKKGQKYPAMLFTAGENDNRVHPLHARKMVAAMQAMASNDATQDPILLWVDRESGHGAGKPLAIRIRDVADVYSFLMWQTGMK